MKHVNKHPYLFLTLLFVCSTGIRSYAQTLNEFFTN